MSAMNSRTVSTAFLIALLISGLLTWLLSHKMSANAAQYPPERRYVAASKALQPGEVLKAADLKFVNWPAGTPIAGAFMKVEDVAGRGLLYPVEEDQPITAKLLAAAGSGMGLATKIPAGMRAVALRSDEVMGVAGFLLPGSHLDVLVTYHTDRSAEPVTLTVLQDAEVLAAGQNMQPDPDGKPVTATVVTLLLKPDDAERAVLASTQGAIHFVLRSGSDKTHLPSSPLALSQLSGAPVISAPTPRAHAIHLKLAVSAPTHVIETINGDKRSTDVFSGAK